MSETRDDPVDLARVADFRLGSLSVSPSARAIRRGDWREMLEPRVMQLLVALHQAGGAVVSRDALIARCWEGRIVGEDAINRAIGKLRRVSESDGGASFTVETIPRVGYRLAAKDLPAGDGAGETAQPIAGQISRRRWLWGASASAVTAAAAATVEWAMHSAVTPAPDPAAMQIARGLQVLRDVSPDSITEAIGVFNNIVTRFPRNAQGWGWLAVAYALQSHDARTSGQSMRLRAVAAADRAVALDPHNAQAFEARGWIPRRRGAWLQAEKSFRQGLQYHPDYDGLLLGLAMRLVDVGRIREAAENVRQALDRASQFDSALSWNGMMIFWSANRLTEADRVAEQAAQQIPLSKPSWFWRVYLLMFTGRAEQALSLLNDADNRPPGIPAANFDIEIAAARALLTGAATDKAAANNVLMASAHQGAGYAENAIMMLCALGFVDDAFRVADALYFGRGFPTSSFRFSEMQGQHNTAGEERTVPLFTPPARLMRQDKRFAPLVAELGLTNYWKESGTPPDYQRFKDP